MKRPILMTGKLVSLGVYTESDAEDLFFESNDPEMNHYEADLGKFSSVEGAKDYIKSHFTNSEKERVFVIVNNDDGRVIGNCGIYTINWKSRNGVVGFMLHKEYWGKGYGTEVAALLVRYAFEMINLRKLVSFVLEPNAASKRVLEKTGFKECGRFTKEVYVHDHGYVDQLSFEIFNQNPQ